MSHIFYRRKEANRDKPDITKVEVHPFNQRILWKYTGLFCKQLKLDLKCIQQAVLPNLKVKSRKKRFSALSVLVVYYQHQ